MHWTIGSQVVLEIGVSGEMPSSMPAVREPMGTRSRLWLLMCLGSFGFEVAQREVCYVPIGVSFRIAMPPTFISCIAVHDMFSVSSESRIQKEGLRAISLYRRTFSKMVVLICISSTKSEGWPVQFQLDS